MNVADPAPPLDVAIVQFRPRKGPVAGNVAALRAAFAELAARPPRLVVLPETALTGYFLEGATVECALTRAQIVATLADAWRAECAAPVEIVCGYYESDGGMLYNSATAVAIDADGARALHTHRKVFLPSYGVFDEARFVLRGRSVRAYEGAGGRMALAVCEDMWHGLVPTIAALEGARLLIVPSASPARGLGGPTPDSLARWHELVRQSALEHGMFVVFASLAGSEGGKMMSGGSCVVDPAGRMLARAPEFEPAIVRARLDFGECDRARAATPLVGALATVGPELMRSALRRSEASE